METIRRRSTTAQVPDDLSEAPVSAFPWRGFVVGIAGVIAGCILTPYSSLYLNSSQLGDDYLPIGVFSLFLGLLLLNGVLRAVGFGLRRADLLLAYIMMLVSAAIPVNGFAARLLPMVTGLYYYSSPINRWDEYLTQYVPSWIGPHDKAVARAFYEGSTLGAVPWESWIAPLATWFVPFAAVGLMTIAIGTLLRRQWLDKERLLFPLAQIPLAVTGEGETPSLNGSLMRNRLFWIAFALPFIINGMNGLHHLFPAIPSIPAMDPQLKTSLGSYFSDPVWSYVYRDFYFEYHFALIGIAMMMRQEVSLSLWFFQVFFFAVLFVFMATGIGPGLYMYTPREQFGYVMFARWTKVGAAVVVVGVILWSLRHELARAARLMVQPWKATDDEEDKALRYPLWGFLAGFALYIGWTYQLGLSLWVACGILVIALGAYIVVARIVSEGGLIWCSVAMDPVFILPTFVGTEGLSPRSITTLAYTGFVPLSARANVLPSLMDSLKIGQVSRIRPRHVIFAVITSLAVAFAVSLGVVLVMSYAQGGNFMPEKHYSYGPRWIFTKAVSYFTDRTGPSWQAIATMVAGMGMMAIMYKLHRRYLWWPFYPLGYVIAETEVMQHQWMSIAIGWAIRSLVIRFGGAVGYRNMKPAAVGVIIGEIVSIMFWFAVFALTGTTGKSLTHDPSTW